jgi:lysophospholipase L1-like esterase/ABC-type branched-subunit amino acid transport system substrate-binding protein
MLALVGEQNDTFLQPLKAGFDDATQYFNVHGGICGATLTQVFADTDVSIQEIYDRSVALDPKPVLVTLYGSGDAEDLRDQLASDEILGLGIRVGSVKALYGEDGQTPGWIFGTNPLYVDQIGSICDYIAANPDLFPKPVLGFISWDESWTRSSETDESRAYCQSVGVGYAGASYFSSDATYIQQHVQNLIDAGATILYTQSLETGPVLVAKTLDEMGLQGKVTLAAANWAMDPTVGLLGGENIRADGLPAMSGTIGSLPLRSWAETDHPGVQLIIEQADLHQRPQQVRNHYYTLAWASTDLYIEVYIQTGNRVGFDHITGADIKETLERIVYSPLGGVETIDFQGGARRTLSANRIGQMNYLGQDGKTPAGANNSLLFSTVDGVQQVVPILVPLSDFQTAPDLRPGGADVPTAAEFTATSSGSSWTYVAFGDSWTYGAHCNGCQPFPGLYADSLAASTEHRIDFVNLTTNGGTSQSLLADIQTSQKIRDVVKSADIIVISTGANDLEDAFGLFAAGNCGGADHFDCFRKVGEVWRTSFDGVLTEINALRSEKPTAIRLVTNSNEALSDPGLIEIFGPKDSSGAGAFITNLHHEILCEVAAKHEATCVDLRPVLNGPNFDKPQDVNTQEAMQAVADALLASGLDELP